MTGVTSEYFLHIHNTQSIIRGKKKFNQLDLSPFFEGSQKVQTSRYKIKKKKKDTRYVMHMPNITKPSYTYTGKLLRE